MEKFKFCLLFLSFLLWSCSPSASLTVVGFNVESGDADPNYIAETSLKLHKNVDIWGFSEVQNQSWVKIFEQSLESGKLVDFQALTGESGNQDKLSIIYNADKLKLIQYHELKQINVGGNVRAALVAHFQIPSKNQEFLFMVNHLYRSKENLRHQQARLLNQWAKRQTLPIIAVGDYNFDWNLQPGVPRHDAGYDLLIQNGVFTWVRPTSLLATHCNQKYNTILDFVFVAGEAKNWQASSKILHSEANYCPDNDRKSDHRPVMATFEIR